MNIINVIRFEDASIKTISSFISNGEQDSDKIASNKAEALFKTICKELGASDTELEDMEDDFPDCYSPNSNDGIFENYVQLVWSHEVEDINNPNPY